MTLQPTVLKLTTTAAAKFTHTNKPFGVRKAYFLLPESVHSVKLLKKEAFYEKIHY